MRMKRVELRAPDAGSHMTLDLILDAKNIPRSGMPFCGWWGRLKSNDVLPLVVLSDGRVDFGSDIDTDQDERFGHINLHGRQLDPDALVTYSDSEQEVLFRVGPATDLLD